MLFTRMRHRNKLKRCEVYVRPSAGTHCLLVTELARGDQFLSPQSLGSPDPGPARGGLLDLRSDIKLNTIIQRQISAPKAELTP
jgi:hypothetical protein